MVVDDGPSAPEAYIMGSRRDAVAALVTDAAMDDGATIGPTDRSRDRARP